jgi:response regulator NasT
VGTVTRAGHKVVGQASNGVEAVELCSRHKPDIVILDNTMTGGNGSVAAKIIYEKKLARGVIIVTLDAQKEAFRCLLDQGAILLGKPCSPKQIMRAVEALVTSLSL